jgi:hypothetical protein
MKFENTHAYNFEGALHGMRNPMNSWDRSDSFFGIVDLYNGNAMNDIAEEWGDEDNSYQWLKDNGILRESDSYNGLFEVAFIGPNDMNLAQKLILAGDEHAKFTRQIFVSVDITAPLYWWKEFDTYKVGTVANSTSTMHKLSAIPITKEMFEFDNPDLLIDRYTIPHGGECETIFDDYIDDIVDMCENLRLKFKETGDAAYWRALVQILPNAYVQTRTVTMSYANLRNIYFQRKNHKLKEWHDFCDWIKQLPYSKDLITIGE